MIQKVESIDNLAIGCEMWENGPVAMISTSPPYTSRWFVDLASSKDWPVWDKYLDGFSPETTSLALFFLDEPEPAYWANIQFQFSVMFSAS